MRRIAVLLLFVALSTSSWAQAQEFIEATESGIPGQYIVVLQSDLDPPAEASIRAEQLVSQLAMEMSSEYGGTILQTYSRAIQ